MKSTSIVKTDGLSFYFNKNEKVLDNINLYVEKGSIYGFLGPNGAGKTTTLRLLLGLLKKQNGKIEIFGKELNDHRIDSLKKIGSLIEQPSLYGHLTARENLEIYRKIYRTSPQKINEVLKLVDLEETGRKKASKFSLGMKQRLSLSIALLHDPELLILDEPTNGLDPNGIIEIRELLKKINRVYGVTIIISSHILPEIERIATHVGIINKGILLFQGKLSELQEMKNKQGYTILETNDNIKASRFLSKDYEVEHNDGSVILHSINKEIIAAVLRRLTEENIDVYKLQPQNYDLEQIFLQLTSKVN